MKATMSPPEMAHLETTRVRFKNILLATDFSPGAQNALRACATIARRASAHLYMLHVVRPTIYPAEAIMVAPVTMEPAVKMAQREMKKLATQTYLKGIEHTEMVREGFIWDEVDRVIRDHHIDLIVAGTHGPSKLEKLMMGSVAEELFRTADCPVLTVGPHVTSASARGLAFKNILFATDFNLHALRAAQYATSLAQEHAARLTFMHVAEPPKGKAINAEVRAQGATIARLRELLPSDANYWCEPHFRVEFGEPATKILTVAAETDADLIVMGVHKGGPAASHSPWATASKVVQHAGCPVLTVRDHL